jgi:hypothetical protein
MAPEKYGHITIQRAPTIQSAANAKLKGLGKVSAGKSDE